MNWTDKATFGFGLFLVLFGLLLGGSLLAYSFFFTRKPIELDPTTAQSLVEELSAFSLPQLSPVKDPLGIIAFSSYACPSCKLHHERYEKGLAERLGVLGYAYAVAPLGVFSSGEEKAKAALCTWEEAPALFPEVHEHLYRFPDLPELPQDVLACIQSDSVEKRLDRLWTLGRRIGVVATPAFYLPPLRTLLTGVQDWTSWNAWLSRLP